jgi:hypothetical protein
MKLPTQIYANYVELGISKNARFDLGHVINRDNSNYPFWLLREKFKNFGIELNTPDLNKNRAIAFELHMNALQSDSAVPKFSLLYETPQIYPENGNTLLHLKYHRIFTWNDTLVDGKKYIKLNLTNKPRMLMKFDEESRDHFCCLIAGNKCVSKPDSKELYSQRLKTIRWFEQHAPNDFDLYGIGWDVPAAKAGILQRLIAKIRNPLYRLNGIKEFPSYRGKVKSKIDILTKYRFLICYENVADCPGYITEKIFDSFFAGCVPVYWGAPNVEEYIPKDCFIDRREYPDHDALYRHLTDMTEVEFRKYQLAIKMFLNSEAARYFYAEAFANTVAASIYIDLGLTAEETL